MRTEADLRAAAERAGGIDLVGTELVPLGDGSSALASVMRFSDPWAAARLLCELSEEDAGDPVVRAWSLAILRATADAIGERAGPTISPALHDAFARALHDNVQSQILFVHEPEETFQSARTTMAVGAGDCDDHARLLYALARAGGIAANLVFFEEPADGSGLPSVLLGGADDTQPVHVVALLRDSDGTWQWAETTIAADYGEEPHDAYVRLGGSAPSGNPFASPAAAAGLGFLGLDFVTPADVQTRKSELDAMMSSLDDDVTRCAALGAATVSSWNEFLAGWRGFYSEAPSFWNAGGQGRQAQDYADALREWQAKVNAVCPISGATVPVAKDENVLGTVATVAVAAAVAVGAWAIAPVLRRL